VIHDSAGGVGGVYPLIGFESETVGGVTVVWVVYPLTGFESETVGGVTVVWVVCILSSDSSLKQWVV
jgi:hypothetical protein